jgi:hypothetical protein
MVLCAPPLLLPLFVVVTYSQTDTQRIAAHLALKSFACLHEYDLLALLSLTKLFRSDVLAQIIWYWVLR